MTTVPYTISAQNGKTLFTVDGKLYETEYSQKVVELLVRRKGPYRAIQYLHHRNKRAFLIKPLLDFLSSSGAKELKVLEIGCEAAHLTEILNAQPFISEITAFDVDRLFVDIAELKRHELPLNKLTRLDCFSNFECINLPYPNGSFDLILAVAVVEHLPFENRYAYVDEWYRKLKVGGNIAFIDTPNRWYPYETHSVGLPFIAGMNPQLAFIYAKCLRKLKAGSFPNFVRAGTGWRNATYYECLPKTVAIDVEDISESVGYGLNFVIRTTQGRWRKRFRKVLGFFVSGICRKLGVPSAFFYPYLQLVFRKLNDYESGEV